MSPRMHISRVSVEGPQGAGRHGSGNLYSCAWQLALTQHMAAAMMLVRRSCLCRCPFAKMSAL